MMLFFDKIKKFNKFPFLVGIIISCIAFFVFQCVFPNTLLKKNIVAKAQNISKTFFADTKKGVVTEAKIEEKQEKKLPEVTFKEPATKKKVNTEKNENKDNNEVNKNENNAEKIPVFPEDKNLYTTVAKDYFDDALFIGDSRTMCLELYGNWKNATYYTMQGISVWKILQENVAKLSDGTPTTLENALKGKQFKKIYIMLGVNELATGTADTFFAQYKKVVDKIVELQPEATIFVQSIIHVSKEKSEAEEFINNPTINERNIKLYSLCDNEKIFFLDANKVLDDENGALKSEYSFDGVHLTADYLYIWKEYLLNHGLKALIPPPVIEDVQAQD